MGTIILNKIYSVWRGNNQIEALIYFISSEEFIFLARKKIFPEYNYLITKETVCNWKSVKYKWDMKDLKKINEKDLILYSHWPSLNKNYWYIVENMSWKLFATPENKIEDLVL